VCRGKLSSIKGHMSSVTAYALYMCGCYFIIFVRSNSFVTLVRSPFLHKISFVYMCECRSVCRNDDYHRVCTIQQYKVDSAAGGGSCDKTHVIVRWKTNIMQRERNVDEASKGVLSHNQKVLFLFNGWHFVF
jgi:hypothetical protein